MIYVECINNYHIPRDKLNFPVIEQIYCAAARERKVAKVFREFSNSRKQRTIAWRKYAGTCLKLLKRAFDELSRFKLPIFIPNVTHVARSRR